MQQRSAFNAGLFHARHCHQGLADTLGFAAPSSPVEAVSLQRAARRTRRLEKHRQGCKAEIMATTATSVNDQYDHAASRWGDKMRTLGYYDGYLGFLSFAQTKDGAGLRVVDVGAGTASFAEAWVAINGAPDKMTLLDPSAAMLERGKAALGRRGVTPHANQGLLGEVQIPQVDVVLAAHVIEHCPDPLVALGQMRAMLCPGGLLRLVVSKPHWCNAIIWLQWRHRTFAKDEILKLVEQAGFAVEDVYAFPSGPPSRTSRGIVARRID